MNIMLYHTVHEQSSTGCFIINVKKQINIKHGNWNLKNKGRVANDNCGMDILEIVFEYRLERSKN